MAIHHSSEVAAARMFAFTALKSVAFDSSSEVATTTTAWELEVALSKKGLSSLEAFTPFTFIA